MKESYSKPSSETVADTSTVDEPKFIDTIDGRCDENTKHVGRVIHL